MVCDLSNPLALYHYTGDTTDSSLNGFDLTNNGAALTTDKNSVSNQAYFYDTTDNMTRASFPMPANVTLNFWLQKDNITVRQRFFDTFASNKGISLEVLATGQLRIIVQSSSGNVHDKYYTYSTTGWKMLTITITGTTVVVYLDGSVATAAVDNSTGTMTWSAQTSTMYIGSSFTSGLNWGGKMDEIRIDNSVKDQDTIDALFSGYDAPTCGVETNALAFGSNF